MGKFRFLWFSSTKSAQKWFIFEPCSLLRASPNGILYFQTCRNHFWSFLKKFFFRKIFEIFCSAWSPLFVSPKPRNFQGFSEFLQTYRVSSGDLEMAFRQFSRIKNHFKAQNYRFFGKTNFSYIVEFLEKWQKMKVSCSECGIIRWYHQFGVKLTSKNNK